MNTQLQTIPQPQTEPIQPQPNIPRWNLALRITFRFRMIYLGLYCLATQVITSLFNATEGTSLPDPGVADGLCRKKIPQLAIAITGTKAFQTLQVRCF